MKKQLFLSMLFGAATLSQAQDLKVSNIIIDKAENHAVVRMDMDLSKIDVRSKEIRVITPRIINGTDTLDLKSVGIYGRNRYYYTLRNPKLNPLTSDDIQLRESEMPAILSYQDVFELQPWMEGSELYIGKKIYGCVSCLLAERLDGSFYQMEQAPQEPEPYKPEFVYVRPAAELVKMRSLAATAYVNFRVSKMDIDPQYMNNTEELGKILATIDEVKKGNKVTGIALKGFASPESPYANNERLAKGRVEALRNYLSNHEQMPKEQIRTEYEPENWEGLRKYVEGSTNLSNKQAILELIDSDREPDNKEYVIRQRFPKDYQYLKDNCYPALRKTDYAIQYEVQHYTDVEEIKRVFKSAPQNLSLEEFYIVAQAYEPGTEEFNEVFQTAVRLFPNDPVANLNAANACMEMGQLTKAEQYLQKAGSLPEAATAREILSELKARAEK